MIYTAASKTGIGDNSLNFSAHDFDASLNAYENGILDGMGIVPAVNVTE